MIWPEQIPYNPNWRSDVTHPLHASRTATVDHVSAHAAGGADLDAINLVTACWACNLQKRDLDLERLGWSLRKISDDGWDGFVGYIAPLQKRLQMLDYAPGAAELGRWQRAFALAASGKDRPASLGSQIA
jgi:hypothetical protein